jgi:hypothetical protein
VGTIADACDRTPTCHLPRGPAHPWPMEPLRLDPCRPGRTRQDPAAGRRGGVQRRDRPPGWLLTPGCGATSRARAVSWPTLPATPSGRLSGLPSVASTGFAARPICRTRFFATADSTCGSNRHPKPQKSLDGFGLLVVGSFHEPRHLSLPTRWIDTRRPTEGSARGCRQGAGAPGAPRSSSPVARLSCVRPSTAASW